MGAGSQSWTDVNSQSGVVGASSFAVACMAVAAASLCCGSQTGIQRSLGLALLLCEWHFEDSWGTASIEHGEVISVLLDGDIATKLSPSVKVMSGSTAHRVPVHSHQVVRLAGNWGMCLLSPMLQSPCIGDGMF